MKKKGVVQVADDFELLQLMLQDEKNANKLYQATSYWEYYETRLLPELREKGLHDFRCRDNSVLKSFGATDLFRPPFAIDHNKLLRRLPEWLRQAAKSKIVKLALYQEQRKIMLHKYYNRATTIGEEYGARPPSDFSASLVGNPAEYVLIGNNVYTWSHLLYYLQYVYCSRFVNFEKISTYAELGSGAGKQTEVLKKMFPQLNILLFDLAPQLYVCEQYLKSVFPGDVISFRETYKWGQIPEIGEGKIAIFGAHSFPLLAEHRVDLFWNSASFQEMEPDVVRNYLEVVRQSALRCYLREKITGKQQRNHKRSHGVMKKVTFAHYVNSLNIYRMLDFSKATTVGYSSLDFEDYYDMFWERM